MTYRGYVKNGAVVLDKHVALPEGTRVQCVLIPAESVLEVAGTENDGAPLDNGVMEFAGKAVGLPPDASVNLDHYLYGHPKR